MKLRKNWLAGLLCAALLLGLLPTAALAAEPTYTVSGTVVDGQSVITVTSISAKPIVNGQVSETPAHSGTVGSNTFSINLEPGAYQLSVEWSIGSAAAAGQWYIIVSERDMTDLTLTANMGETILGLSIVNRDSLGATALTPGGDAETKASYCGVVATKDASFESHNVYWTLTGGTSAKTAIANGAVLNEELQWTKTVTAPASNTLLLHIGDDETAASVTLTARQSDGGGVSDAVTIPIQRPEPPEEPDMPDDSDWAYYSFANSSADFFRAGETRNYPITAADKNVLRECLSSYYGSSDGKYLYQYVVDYADHMNWGGSCFGIALTEGLYNSDFNTLGLSSLPGASAPKDDAELRSAINFYFVTQMLPGFRAKQHWGCHTVGNTAYYNQRIDWTGDLKGLVDALKRGPGLFCYQFVEDGNMYGHAIILESVKSEKNGVYTLLARDNRFPGTNGTGETEIVVDLNGTDGMGSLVLHYPNPYYGSEEALEFDFEQNFKKYQNAFPLPRAGADDGPVGLDEIDRLGYVVYASGEWDVETPDGTMNKTADGFPMGDGYNVTLDALTTSASLEGNTPSAAIYGVKNGGNMVFKPKQTASRTAGGGFYVSYAGTGGFASVSANGGATTASATMTPTGQVEAKGASGSITLATTAGNGSLVQLTANVSGGDLALTPTGTSAQLTAPAGSYQVSVTDSAGREESYVLQNPTDGAITVPTTDPNPTPAPQPGPSDNSGGGGDDDSDALYHVVYHPGYSNGPSKVRTGGYEKGDTVTLRENPFDAPAGKTFAGWSETEGGRAQYQPGETLKMPGSTLNLYAVWSGGESKPAPETPVAPALDQTNHDAYLTGYADGRIGPNDLVTREQAAAIFYRLLDAESLARYQSTDSPFPDVAADRWSAGAVATMAKAGILKGLPGGTFGPEAPVTRAELASIAARFDAGTYSGPDLFQDIAGHWAANEINRACARGWVRGTPDGLYRPDAPVTRAEAAAMLNRMLGRAPETAADLLDGMQTFPDNADPAAWYYLDLQEASNGHRFERKQDGIHEAWTGLT